MAIITDKELEALGLKMAGPDHPIYKVGAFVLFPRINPSVSIPTTSAAHTEPDHDGESADDAAGSPED